MRVPRQNHASSMKMEVRKGWGWEGPARPHEVDVSTTLGSAMTRAERVTSRVRDNMAP